MYIPCVVPVHIEPILMESNSFGQWLRSERKSRRLTLESLAERTGGDLTYVAIGDWERGKRSPRPASLDLLVSALAGPDATPEDVEALRREALAASVGLSGEIERVPDDEELQRRIVAYDGPNPILSAAAATARGMKEALDKAKPLEEGEVLVAQGRGPRKKWEQ